MGTRLLGVDLDESPVGGIVERLLSEEELEKLADGGRAPADDASDDADDVGTDLVDDAVEADDSEPSTVPVGTGAGGPSYAATSPSPGDDSVGRREPVPSPGAEDVAGDDGGGWKAKLRSVLPKVAVGLVVLAVVALVAYRYLGKAKSVASDKLGSDDESESPPTTAAASPGATGDVPAARRRAKAARPESERSEPREEFGDQPVTESVRQIEDAAGESGGAADRSAVGDEAEPDSVGRPTDDSDVGALVGLAALAVVAAAVRKFGTDRPRDPLVDGPADAGDDE